MPTVQATSPPLMSRSSVSDGVTGMAAMCLDKNAFMIKASLAPVQETMTDQRPDAAAPVFKIVDAAAWSQAQRDGVFAGAPVDHADGFIHLSAAHQARETAAKHFAGRRDLLLVAYAPVDFGDALRWESSRGGALFPHVYATLDPARALWAKPLPLRDDGTHDWTGLLP